MATITLGANVYTAVTMPVSPSAPATIAVGMEDSVAVVESPFVPSQSQLQQWPGADRWTMSIELPPMSRARALPWLAFLASLQGMLNVFQLGDPLGRKPSGVAQGAPVVAAGTGLNAVSAIALSTRGWVASKYGQLNPGDYLQVGYRLHQVTAQVNSDSSGNATIALWPSLRETPADGTAIHLVNAQGVFRLATNKRQWHASPRQLTQISFAAIEVR
jgi:hypothetical protein